VGSQLNLVDYVFRSRHGWIRNVGLVQEALKNDKFDLVIGNETYEIIIGLIFRLTRIKVPFVMIYDFLGLESTTSRVLEKIGKYAINLIWSLDRTVFKAEDRLALFIGEPEDIPTSRFGFLLPRRRDYSKAHYHFVGYIVRFDPKDYRDKSRIRAKLGYGNEPLVLCSIGGTSIGSGLLDLCSQAYPLIKAEIPELRMVFVSGPRLSPSSISAHPEITIHGYMPDLFEHYAACDMAIVQAGLSSTCELTALQRPFIHFPVQGHSEQEKVAATLARYNAGIKMHYSNTTPSAMAELVIKHLNKKTAYPPLPVDGAKKAAQLIRRFL
jgi:UDP-N-acetylglucosamine:LPS N-acetylglucosamine transferase